MLQRKWQNSYTSFAEKYRMYLLIIGKNRGLASRCAASSEDVLCEDKRASGFGPGCFAAVISGQWPVTGGLLRSSNSLIG
jgi:hypothetical protein